MALRPEFSLGHSEFNEFLFALVGEEKSGLELTVLSALTRLGIDPWREAARLSGLPKETAARIFATTIASLPPGKWSASDSMGIAVRLVERLPRHYTAVSQAPPAETLLERKTRGLPLWLGAFLKMLAAGKPPRR
ncbi:hypothetical protein [Telmatospirillum siberiense]|uniref:Uncharacterized protein n=1 Tax=Telmatospirillum siberiense TaxID=382514 RepID=A0A2N3PXQ9_9PROT|nr:hypothetical protein [Telmatospirillum siberiense]PKU25200.1 hypothetical protein CWS72_08385 [Telmatospirillum siberiense]